MIDDTRTISLTATPALVNRGSKSLLPWVILAVATVTAIGIALVATAPLDGAARNNLGVGLLTGVVVGASLIGVEYALDRRREARELKIARDLQDGFLESARLGIADLVIDHVEQLVVNLMMTTETLDPKAHPAGWQGDSDRSLVVRGLMWTAELPLREVTWWRTPRTIATVDALFLVATDVAERYGVEVSDDDRHVLGYAIERAASRINTAAERLSESGDPYRAHELDKLADTLLSQDVRTALPDLGTWGNEYFDAIITAGGDFDRMRQFVAYLTDLLRSDLVSGGGDRNERLSDDQIATRRWGELFETGHPLDSSIWEVRFHKESWLRKVLDQTSVEITELFLGQRPTVN